MWFEFLVKLNQNVKGLHFAPHKICAVLEKSVAGISESFEEKQVPFSHCFSWGSGGECTGFGIPRSKLSHSHLVPYLEPLTQLPRHLGVLRRLLDTLPYHLPP